MSTWSDLSDLPVSIDGYDLSGLEQEMGPDFTRMCTFIRLHGGGEEGVGEDVVYDALDHIAFQDEGEILDLTGPATLGELSELMDALDLFPRSPPVRDEVSRNYRRWAFESAALDLALRQAGRPLGDAVARAPRPLSYVVSMRLPKPDPDGPESADRLHELLTRYPSTRFKLDPTTTWTDALIAELAATGAVDSLDLKGHYKGTPVDVVTDPDLYRRVAEAFPTAWLEDPDLSDPAAADALAGEHDRITWDAPIHSVADIEALPFAPKTVNVKPSRLGGLRSLCAAYDYCERQGIGAYGGGQTELGVGRDHIQYLAAVFHPATPNEVAPREFNHAQVPDGLPETPLDLPVAATGFRFSRPGQGGS
ncbi:MAG: hypothetical protein ACR2HC_07940 [Thermoleophilaceae bacterium]